MDKDKNTEQPAEKQASVLTAPSIAWALPNPKAMPLGSGAAPHLGQTAHQNTVPGGTQHTVSQWAKPLHPITITRGNGAAASATCLDMILYRVCAGGKHDRRLPGRIHSHSQVQDHPRNPGKTCGRVQRQWVFHLPRNLRPQSLAVIVDAAASAHATEADKTPFLRCALQADLVLPS